MRLPRPAPNARRTAISFCRAEARAISRFARFEQAISSTRPTMPISAKSGFEYVLRRFERPFDPGITSIHIFRNSCLTNGDALANGFSVTSRFRIWWNSGCSPACAFSSVIPGLRRPKTSTQRKRLVFKPAEIGARQVVLHRDRNANLRRAARFHAVESRRAHADNRQRPAVDHDLLSDDAGVRAETRPPIAVAEHGQRMAALNQVVGSGEHPAHRRADAEHRKVIARHEIGADQFRAALERRAHGTRVRAEHAAEDLVLVADLLIHRVGEPVRPVVAAIVFAASGQHHQLLRISHRKRLQDELVDQCEDRGVGADAQGQRKHRYGQKNGRLAQSTQGIPEISQDCGHRQLYCAAAKRLPNSGCGIAAHRSGLHAGEI